VSDIVGFEQGRTDVVAAVLHLIDGLTRRTVTRGVGVRLWDKERQAPRPARVVRNHSGLFVLLNHPADETLTFRVTAGPAGYRDPCPISFRPSASKKVRLVTLERRPDADFGDVAVLIRGTVIRSIGDSPGPAANLKVSAAPPRDVAGHQFPATTDENGVFALAVGILPREREEPAAQATILSFGDARQIPVHLRYGWTYTFEKEIDLDGHDDPDLIHQSIRSART
jgi:hypothetical protein